MKSRVLILATAALAVATSRQLALRLEKLLVNNGFAEASAADGRADVNAAGDD